MAFVNPGNVVLCAMKKLILAVCALLLWTCEASPQWQTPDKTVPIGRGLGTGFNSLAPGVLGNVMNSDGTNWRSGTDLPGNYTVGSMIFTAVVSKVGTGTSSASDCGKRTNLGGNASYTFSPGAPGGFPEGCTITFTNVDATRGKILSVSGYAVNRRLYPEQTIQYTIVSGAWKLTIDPGRWRPLSEPKIYVNISGSDTTNDCLATGAANACGTIQRAVDICTTEVSTDLVPTVWTGIGNAGYRIGCVVQLDQAIGGSPHTVPAPIFIDGLAATAPVTIRGDLANPSLYNVGCTNALQAFTAQNGGVLIVEGVALAIRAAGANCTLLNAIEQGKIGVRNIELSAQLATGGAIGAADQSSIDLIGPVTFAGGTWVTGLQGLDQSRVMSVGATITFSATNVFTSAFLVLTNSILVTEGSPLSFVNPGNVTGKSYIVSEYSQIAASNPGSIPGTAGSIFSGSFVNAASVITTSFGTGNTCPAGKTCTDTPDASANDRQVPSTEWVRTAVKQVLALSSGNFVLLNAGETIYFSTGTGAATEAVVRTPMPIGATASKMYVIASKTPGGTDTYTITLRKNSAATALTCTITGAANSCNDTVHSVTYAVTDQITVEAVASATAASSTLVFVGVALSPTP